MIGRSNRGQALVEFLIVLPILLLLVIAALQVYLAQDKAQKAQSAVWFVLRGGSFDFERNHVKKEDIQKNVEALFDEGDTVSVRLDEAIQKKGSPDPDWARGSAVLLGGLSLLNPLDFSMLRQATIEVSFENPFHGLRIPGTEFFGGLIDDEERISVAAQGLLWTSWTAMAKQPNFDWKKAKEHALDVAGDVGKKGEAEAQGVSAAESQASACHTAARRYREQEKHTKDEAARRALERKAQDADRCGNDWTAYKDAFQQALNSQNPSAPSPPTCSC